jgi:hypothetical protein
MTIPDGRIGRAKSGARRHGSVTRADTVEEQDHETAALRDDHNNVKEIPKKSPVLAKQAYGLVHPPWSQLW